MENANPENKLLKNKYDLHKSPEVEASVRRTKAIRGERIPQDPLLRIQNYLTRFHEVTDRADSTNREHGIDAGKRLLHRKFVIKPQEIPESYFDNQRRLAREQGHGDNVITREIRDQLTEVIIADQESSLDKWVDYLSSSDAPYSDGLKYYALRSVLNMGTYDKEKHAFPTRAKRTISPFPDLNREALAYVLDAIDKKYRGYDIDLSQLEESDKAEFEKLLTSENFARLYAWAIEKVTPATPEELAATGGEWKKYSQGSDPIPLVKSLQGHGTGWCTAGESTAQAQLQGGDFYVYYSLDKNGKPNIPRVAIRMEEDRIAEVRGISAEQNLDSGVESIVEEKLKDFPDGGLYKKRVIDMKTLTAIESKMHDGQELNSQELKFLYEVDSDIEGFGYQKDPRIGQLMSYRDPTADMSLVFECEPSQIAESPSEVNENTKVYIGAFKSDIFEVLRKYNIKHLFTQFPRNKVFLNSVKVEEQSGEDIEFLLSQNNILVTDDASSMLKNKDLVNHRNENVDFVVLRTGDLDPFFTHPSLGAIFNKANELGLELCPPELAPYFSLQHGEIIKYGTRLYFGMKPISGNRGSNIFCLYRDEEGLMLDYAHLLHPQLGIYEKSFSSDDKFVFSLGKLS